MRSMCSECPVYAGYQYIEILKTSLRFYFMSNVNKLESVLSQKIFDPTSIVLINIKQLNKTVWHINITTFEEL